MFPIKFKSFGKKNSGKVISADNKYAIVQCRNPHGSHNLVVVDKDRGDAILHGSLVSLNFAIYFMGRHYRKVRKHLAKKGLGIQLKLLC